MDAFDLRQWDGFTKAGGQLLEPAVVNQISIDSRRIDSSQALFVALKGEKEDGHSFIEHAAQAGAKYALVCSHYPDFYFKNLTLLRVPDPLKAFQAIVKAYRHSLPTKIIGITGSFGKTMVKDLLYTLLSTEKKVTASPESFNSQIGVALSLLTIQQHHEIAIIEAAVSEPQEMDYLADLICPDYTLLTPMGKKHLATLDDMPTLMYEIFKLIKKTSHQGWSLLPYEPALAPHYPQLSSPYFFWNQDEPNFPHASLLQSSFSSFYQLSFPNGTSFKEEIKIGHVYFLNLINMACKAAWLLGISSHHMISVLQKYLPEPTRTEIWKSALGTIFINDTYCSDPQSIDQSLKHYSFAKNDSRKFFIFGGMRDASLSAPSNYQCIGKALAKANIHQLLLVGDVSFKPLTDEMSSQSPHTTILTFNNYPDTFSYLSSHLQSHDCILFKGKQKLSLDLLTETFNDSLANNQCTINLAAITTNLTLIKKKLPKDTRLMVCVKALAYGTDDIHMAKFFAKIGIDILCVSYVDEGVVLRRAGINQAIFSINATPYEAAKVVKWNLEVGVSDASLIEALNREAQKQSKCIKVHLHINTGMGRFGCRPEEALMLAQQIVNSSFLELEGLMTHFAAAEDPNEDPFTYHQIALFDQTIQQLAENGIRSRWTHAANSSAAIRLHLPQYNMVRLGLAVYGLYVSDDARQAFDLRLALSLTSRIVGLNVCKKGESISYGRSYRIERESQKIAVLPIGYFDGLHRNYSGKSDVFIRGQKATMVGNICMDYMMVDVTDIPNVSIGDQVLIFGEDEFGYYSSPEELAKSGDSIIHELITCLGPRIQRIFVYEESKQIR